ncbi:isopentenyl-diphosphate Delta-isomerase [Profundibacterium mesophilum]|uniref:Isopentenyl-diphosphate Delta-isomerase n=1 Tax=Profundibacterium mesophilum KAUST100406-0324 TaxID=1037889 RepID=A0A921TCQ1_9RHOB|nr:NUDIX domain-containing protein [Profundibacterium mesophilum]KAF0675943.1 Isopentenyl-diphosphate Delta-isomerase [Profundibacterium mesophilum KAUST100406-0324]
MSRQAVPVDAAHGRIPAWEDDVLRPVDKLEVHLRGLRHKAVSVFVNHGGETLLQRRAAGKYHTPGLWANACCTHPAWGETDADCARRRLGEELGLWHLHPCPRAPIEYRADVGGGMTEHEVVALFVAEPRERPLPRPDPSEVADTRWIGLDALRAEIAEAPERFTPWLRIYLDRHAGEFDPA